MRALQKQVRLRLGTEADAAVNLDVHAGIADRRIRGHEEGAFDGVPRIPPTGVDRDGGKGGQVARAASGDRHVGTMMLDRLEAADRAPELFSYHGILGRQGQRRLSDPCHRRREQQPQRQQLVVAQPMQWRTRLAADQTRAPCVAVDRMAFVRHRVEGRAVGYGKEQQAVFRIAHPYR